ncbi:hypothetical protein N9937_01405 [bacterium]|nr:hypothetical protein [bacterium]
MSELREALDEAYSEDESETVDTEVATEEPADVGEAVESPEPVDEEAESEPVAEDSVPEPEGKSEPVQEGPKAPVDWSPELRETWGDLPAPVRDKILDRERHMAQAMQGTAQARQAHQQLGQLQNQYGAVIAAEGASNPIQAAAGLLQTATELRLGTPQQKATKLAELVKHFGVDVGMLDSALVGETPETSQFEQLLDQRLAPVNQMMSQLGQLQQNSNQQSSQQVQAEMAEFSKGAEFLQDVRMDMADLIEMATNRGQEMTLQSAYDKACMLNPQIQGVLNQRKEAQSLIQSQQSLASKKNAASSLAPRGAEKSSKGPADLHGFLSQAWDDLAGS